MTLLDLLRVQLLLRRRHGVPQAEHARILLGLLPPRHQPLYATGPLRHHRLRVRVIHGHSVGRHVLLRQERLGPMVSGGRRLQRLLRPGALYPQLYTELGLLSRW